MRKLIIYILLMISMAVAVNGVACTTNLVDGCYVDSDLIVTAADYSSLTNILINTSSEVDATGSTFSDIILNITANNTVFVNFSNANFETNASWNVTLSCGDNQSYFMERLQTDWAFDGCTPGGVFPNSTWSGGSFHRGTYYFDNSFSIGNGDAVYNCTDSTFIGDGTSTGLLSNAKNQVTIKNCNLINYNVGLFNLNSDHNILDNINITNSTLIGMRIRESLNVTLINSFVEGGSSSGLNLIFDNNINITNSTIFGNGTYSILMQGAENSTFHHLNIGRFSTNGIKLVNLTDTPSNSNNFSDIVIDSVHRVPNLLAADLDDGFSIEEGNNNIFTNITLINWGHASINLFGDNIDYCVNNNTFSDILIYDTTSTYNRGLIIDGAAGCAMDNTFYDIEIRDTTVVNQLNGNNNLFYDIIIDNVTNSIRDLPTEVGQGISVSHYCQNCVSVNNTFENITIIETESTPITIGNNVTGHVFRNINIQRTEADDDYFVWGNIVSAFNNNFSVFNTIKDTGQINYRIRMDFSAITFIIINETSSSSHMINFSDGRVAKFVGDFRKDLMIANNSVNLTEAPAFNFYCPSAVTACQNNVRGINETIDSGFSVLGMLTTSSDPRPVSIATTITDVGYIWVPGLAWLYWNQTGTGSTTLTNLTQVNGVPSSYNIYRDGALILGNTNANDQTVTGAGAYLFGDRARTINACYSAFKGFVGVSNMTPLFVIVIVLIIVLPIVFIIASGKTQDMISLASTVPMDSIIPAVVGIGVILLVIIFVFAIMGSISTLAC